MYTPVKVQREQEAEQKRAEMQRRIDLIIENEEYRDTLVILKWYPSNRLDLRNFLDEYFKEKFPTSCPASVVQDLWDWGFITRVKFDLAWRLKINVDFDLCGRVLKKAPNEQLAVRIRDL